MIISLDHIAWRVKDKKRAMYLFELLGYKHSEDFELDFEEMGKSESSVMSSDSLTEVFISDGDGIVGNWVKEHGSNIHHIAFKTNNIKEDIFKLSQEGITFTTEEEAICGDLKQIFTDPIEALGGITIELIERQTKGFCVDNVKKLMESTVEK